jgi:hypothetical protein
LDINPAYPEVAFNFNLIPQSLQLSYKDKKCSDSFRGVLDYEHVQTPECDVIINEIMDLTVGAGLNWYDLFRKNYPDSLILADANREGKVMINGEEKTYRRGRTLREYTPWLNKKILESDNHPLLGDGISTYVNSPATRAALHVPDSAPGWNQCTPDDSPFFYML